MLIPREYSCKDCTDRHMNCHAKCEKYIEEKRTNEIKNAIINSEIAKEICYEEYKKNAIKRCRKYGGKK